MAEKEYESWYDKTEEGKAEKFIRNYHQEFYPVECEFWERHKDDFVRWEKMRERLVTQIISQAI